MSLKLQSEYPTNSSEPLDFSIANIEAHVKYQTKNATKSNILKQRLKHVQPPLQRLACHEV